MVAIGEKRDGARKAGGRSHARADLVVARAVAVKRDMVNSPG